MDRTQIYFPKNKLAKLRKIARKRNTTVSDVIRQLVDKGMSKEEQPQKTPKKFKSILETAQEIEQMGHKGPKDLARNLDKYLYGDK